MNKIINEARLERGKNLSYNALSKTLSSEAVEKFLGYVQETQRKINSYQKKIKKGTPVSYYLEMGAPILGILGKTAGVINSRYEISGLDSLETVAHLADYSKKRQLTVRGEQMNELLNELDTKLGKLAKFFRHLDDIKQQGIRREEWLDINCPMNFIEIDDSWEGEKELADIELELEREQEKRNKISQEWEEIKEKDYQPELTIKATIGTFDEEGALKDNLADALTNNEWKQIINSSSEAWIDWERLAQQSSSNHSDSMFLKYTKKGQRLFKAVDEKINSFTGEIATIKGLICEVEKQLGYSRKIGLNNLLHLDDEKLIKSLRKVVKWADKVDNNVSWVNSYVKEGGNFVDKVVNSLERKTEYRELNSNPYAYNDKKHTLVFEKEIDKKAEEQKAQVQEPNKGWFSKIWKK